MSEFDVKLLSGPQALAWLSNPANTGAWNRLQSKCVWATPFQSVAFAKNWLKSYGDDWEPILITARDPNEGLAGILPLVRRNNEITGLGTHHAEYQGWLCLEPHIGRFSRQVIESVFPQYPESHLRLKYVDFGPAAQEVVTNLRALPNVLITTHNRPLLSLDLTQILATLRKKSNRSKLNRLKRLGDLELVSEAPGPDPEAVVDEFISLYDLRQGAINGTSPFFEDARKRGFHLDWLKNNDNQLIFYRLLLDGKLVAGLLGVACHDKVSNAIVASSATMAKHSPGKLIIYLAAEKMAEAGYSWFDLTPGGDPWKERFADQHDEVLEINAWADTAPVKLIQAKEKRAAIAKSLINGLGINPSQARDSVKKIMYKARHPRTVIDKLKSLSPKRVEHRVYSFDLRTCSHLLAQFPEQEVTPHKNDAADLVLFQPQANHPGRQAFLAAALARLEAGQCCYSVAKDGTLLHLGWEVDNQETSFFSEVGKSYTYSPAGTVLYDFYTHPLVRGRGFYQQTLAYILREKVAITSTAHADENRASELIYISVLADNLASRHTIEKLGFEYIESISRRKVFGIFVSEAI